MRLCLFKKNNKTGGKTSGAIGLDLGVFVLGLVGPTPESTWGRSWSFVTGLVGPKSWRDILEADMGNDHIRYISTGVS